MDPIGYAPIGPLFDFTRRMDRGRFG